MKRKNDPTKAAGQVFNPYYKKQLAHTLDRRIFDPLSLEAICN
ncbi:hypothetical protein [Arenibacter palladensis]|nr:hypothetical protein [Arenibacter palladensis]